MTLPLRASKGVGHRYVKNARSLLDGMTAFMDRHTGTVSTFTDRYVMNLKNVVADTLHYDTGKSDTRIAQQASSRNQASLILGYYWMYKATGQSRYLDRATAYMDAYIRYYYGGVNPPGSASLYKANATINGKNSFQGLGPEISNTNPNPGTRSLEVTFFNGAATIPSTSLGERLYSVFKVYTGSLEYDSVRSGVSLNQGEDLMLSSYTAYDGKTYNSEGIEISNDYADSPGRVRIQDNTFNGQAKVAFATLSGSIIAENSPYSYWPILGSVTPDRFANDVEAEQWFCEAAYLLHEINGSDTYQRAFAASLFTCKAMVPGAASPFYFRKAPSVDLFTVGRAFWSSDLSDSQLAVSKTTDGYLSIQKLATTTLDTIGNTFIKQEAILNRLLPTSQLNLDLSVNSSAVSVEVRLVIDGGQTYIHTLSDTSVLMNTRSVPLKSFRKLNGPDGNPYKVIDARHCFPFSGASARNAYASDLIAIGRSDTVAYLTLPNTDAGVTVPLGGFGEATVPLDYITYNTTSQNVYLRFTDSGGVRRRLKLPATPYWTTMTVDWSKVEYLDGTGAGSASPTEVMSVEFFSTSGNENISVFCFGTPPPVITPVNQLVSEMKIHFISKERFQASLGDVEMINPGDTSPKYTPGVMPLTPEYGAQKTYSGYWKTTPQIGAQSPVLWAITNNPSYYLNVANFYADAQQAYYDKFKVWGPAMPEYVWPAYDNLVDGPADTFVIHKSTMGQARAFHAAARLWKYLVDTEVVPPTSLVTYCTKFLTFLDQFQINNAGKSPTTFNEDGSIGHVPTDDLSLKGYVTATYLSAAVLCLGAGADALMCNRVIGTCLSEVQSKYVVATDRDQHMSGSFSTDVDQDLFFGSCFGDVLQGLSNTILWFSRKDLTPDTVNGDIPFILADERVLLLYSEEPLLMTNPSLEI